MRKFLPLVLSMILICAALTGCSKKQPEPEQTQETFPKLFEAVTDDRTTVFAANYESDRPVCVTYIATDDGKAVSSPAYDPKTIDAVFSALSGVTVGDECTSIMEGYDRTFVFTMKDGREYSFSFNILSVDIGGTERVVWDTGDLWNVSFPLHTGATLADILADGDVSVAASIYAAGATGAEFSYNGGGVSFTSDPEVAGRAADIVRSERPVAALTEDEFSRQSADETPFTLRLIMDDGAQHTFRFAGECMLAGQEGGAVYYYCFDAVREILALGFDGYGELVPALDENGRKLVDDAYICAGEDGAILLIHSDYIPGGASFVVARDVTVAGTVSSMRLVYNFGEERRYPLAEDFEAVAGGRTLDKAELTAALREASAALDGKQDKKGLTPAQYDFLWRATFSEAGEIVRMEKINVT
jgi:hypothetical protein